MLNIGLTGGIGSGKSTVARMFGQMGAVILDADALVRGMLEPGQEAAKAVAEALGSQVLDPGGGVNRKALAELVFRDEDVRRRIEALLHPRVVAARRKRVRALEADSPPGLVVIAEAALIFEAGTWTEFDGVILVTAPAEIRKARLEAAGWGVGEVVRRMAAQWPEERKAELADWVVDNGGPEEDTRSQVRTLWARFQSMSLAREPWSRDDGETK